MKTRAWRTVMAAGAVAVALGAGPASATRGAGSPPDARPTAIGIKEFKFSPAVMTVPAGTTVTWVNHDEEPHTITSATGTFTSRGLSLEEKFSQTFARAGRYDYFCALHPMMKATVVVQ